MYSKQELINQLKALNAPRKTLVTVHTSLRAIGETEGRGEGVLEALIDYFTEDGGILTIPTHTWKNLARVTKQQPYGTEPTLDEGSNETSIGTLPSIAATHPIRHHLGHPSYHYPKLEAAFRYHGAIEYGQFGKAKVQLCNCRKMYDIVKLIYSRSGGEELMNDDEPLRESLYT